MYINYNVRCKANKSRNRWGPEQKKEVSREMIQHALIESGRVGLLGSGREWWEKLNAFENEIGWEKEGVEWIGKRPISDPTYILSTENTIPLHYQCLTWQSSLCLTLSLFLLIFVFVLFGSDFSTHMGTFHRLPEVENNIISVWRRRRWACDTSSKSRFGLKFLLAICVHSFRLPLGEWRIPSNRYSFWLPFSNGWPLSNQRCEGLRLCNWVGILTFLGLRVSNAREIKVEGS